MYPTDPHIDRPQRTSYSPLEIRPLQAYDEGRAPQAQARSGQAQRTLTREQQPISASGARASLAPQRERRAQRQHRWHCGKDNPWRVSMSCMMRWTACISRTTNDAKTVKPLNLSARYATGRVCLSAVSDDSRGTAAAIAARISTSTQPKKFEMAERSTYTLKITWTDPPFDREEREKMTLTDTLAYLRSVITSSTLGKPTTIEVTRNIPE
jgi:hypothetical protein